MPCRWLLGHCWCHCHCAGDLLLPLTLTSVDLRLSSSVFQLLSLITIVCIINNSNVFIGTTVELLFIPN